MVTLSTETLSAVYYASLGVWAALTLFCLAFYVREWVRSTRALRVMQEDLQPGEMPGVKLFDAFASREVAATATYVLLCYVGLIIISAVIVPPHTVDLTFRALLARLLLLGSVFFLLRGYARWQRFRDDERRQSVYSERLEEVKKSFGV